MTPVLGTTTPAVTRRTAGAGDEELLRALFEQSRDDLAFLPPALIDLQYRARAAQVGRDHPDASNEVILVDDAAAGSLMIADDGDAVRVVDIVIAPDHRRRGIAAAVMAQVIESAGDRAVRLSVWSENASARALYERLGFAVVSSASGYLEMEHR